MAFGMKQWIGVTLVALALVAVWRLPPEARASADEGVRTAEQIRLDRLRAEANATSEVLFRMMWVDSLSSAAVARAREGMALLTPPLEGGVVDQARRLEERIRSQVRARTHREEPVVFGYVLQPHDHRREDGARSPSSRTETYVGTREGVDYCLQVRVFPRGYVEPAIAHRLAGNARIAPYTDELGPCRFYLSHGLAGPHVQSWLESGGVELAYEGEGDPPIGVDGMPLRGPGRRGLFGYGYLTRSDRASDIERCLAGVAPACAAIFEDVEHADLIPEYKRDIVRRSPATGLGSRNPWTPLRDRSYILAELETEFGADAFGRFWTSEDEVGNAFESAFGIDPGRWLLQRVDRLQGIEEPGPGLPGHASTGSMLTIGALLGIAYLRRRERTVVS